MIVKDSIIGPIIKNLKIRNKTIVLTGGCFDVLHEAHIEFLKKARMQGDTLVLLLESDENIRKMKGESRPVNNFDKRAKNLEALGIIDYIVELSSKVSDKYYFNLTKLIQPDIIALTKGDPLTEKKKQQAIEVGGQIKEIMERNKNYSSTKIINK